MIFISLNVANTNNKSSLSMKSQNKKEKMGGAHPTHLMVISAVSALSQEVSPGFPIHTGKP